MQGTHLAAVSCRGLDFLAVGSTILQTRAGGASAQAAFTTDGTGDGETAVEYEEVK
jgi:hypothetical protein